MKKWRILIISLVVILSFVLVSAVYADTTYVVRYGDTLWRIARWYGTTPESIANANPKITNINLIYVGDILVIPGVSGPGTGGQGDYIIQTGDTLYSIARRNGTTVQAILQANPYITNPNLIFIGNRLTIPAGNTNTSSGTGTQVLQPALTGNIYIVRPGDGLMSIARRYGTTVEILLSLNPHITNRDLILVGDRIQLPGG